MRSSCLLKHLLYQHPLKANLSQHYDTHDVFMLSTLVTLVSSAILQLSKVLHYGVTGVAHPHTKTYTEELQNSQVLGIATIIRNDQIGFETKWIITETLA